MVLLLPCLIIMLFRKRDSVAIFKRTKFFGSERLDTMTNIITGSPRYPQLWMKHPHEDVLTILALLSLKDDGYILKNIYSFCLSQPSGLKLWLLLPSFPSLSCPESSSPLELPPMCSRSRHAACMPMGGSSQLRLLQVAEDLTLSRSAILIS